MNIKRFLLQLPTFIWIISIYLVVYHLLSKTSTEWSSAELMGFLLEVLVGVISFIFITVQITAFINKRFKGFKADMYSLLANGSLLILGVAVIMAILITGVDTQNVDVIKEEPVKAATHNLISSGIKLGSSGKEVSIVQAALKRDSSLYPSGLVTGYYGEQTKQAVINFQEKYDLEPSGEVDQQTADKFNEIFGTQSEEFYISSSPSPTTAVVNNNRFVDPDPVIDCSVHANCGGGSRQLRKSICKQSVCCQLHGSWIFYESDSKCIEDQNRNTQHYNNYTPPAYTPYPTWAPWPTTDYSYPSGANANNTPPTNTPYVPQITKSECQASVNAQYGNLMRSSGCSYPCPDSGDCGETSACVVMWSSAQKAMSQCDQYP